MIAGVARAVRRVASDVAAAASVLEILVTPAAWLEIQAGRMTVRCPACRQASTILVRGDLARVAEALAARPDPATRTCLAHESVADLERENAAHGLTPHADDDAPPPATGVPVAPHPPRTPSPAAVDMVVDEIDPIMRLGGSGGGAP